MLMLSASAPLKVYAICVVILSFQMLLLGGLTARARAVNKRYMNPEDVKVSSKDATLTQGEEHPDVARIQRAHRNLLESLPLFIGLGLLYVFAGATELGAQIYFGTFTGARVLHSIAYIKGLQPWRTMMFGIGALTLAGLMVQIVMAALA